MHGQRGNEEDRTHFFNRHINNKEIKVKETVYNSQALRRRGVCLWWVLLVLCRGCKGGGGAFPTFLRGRSGRCFFGEAAFSGAAQGGPIVLVIILSTVVSCVMVSEVIVFQG